MNAEEWRPVVGFEGRYEVSNIGRVRSLNYRMRKGVVHVLRPAKNTDGYLDVHLYALDGGKTYKVHRIVAQAFIPNPDELPEINHKDENKSNNRVENLEWCSRDGNMHYGAISARLVERQSKPVLARDPQTGRVIARFSSAEAAKEQGFIPSEVSRCCRGARGRVQHRGLVWEYDIKGGEVT